LKKSQDSQRIKDHLIRSFVSDKKLASKIPAEAAGIFPLTSPAINKFHDELKKQQKGKKREPKKAIEIRVPKKEHGTPEPARDAVTGYNEKTLDEEGIFIVNAGIVLLHPFLKSLFSRLLLIKDNSFVDEPAQETSLYLLHYVGTGKLEAEEFELVLAKILCAWPVEKPVKSGITLIPAYTAEADQMMEAAIEQFSILKNTSVAGLREGFLQRPGKLFSKDGDIRLRVEKSSIDLLLDYLPWNLGIIVLPWMKDILRVEWR
jgi:hypothetical protein